MRVDFHFDPACPWTWLTSRWLLQVADATDDVEVGFQQLALWYTNRDREVPEEYRGPTEAGRRAHRIIRHLIAAGDQQAVARFYETYGRFAHAEEREQDAALVLEAAGIAGLDEAAIAAADDVALDEIVGGATEQILDEAGGDVGSPVISWETSSGQRVAASGPIIDALPRGEAVAALWRAFKTVVEMPEVKEIKRGRTAPPRTAGT